MFCEKPLDLDLNKINKCKKRISKYNPKIQIGFNRRYDPAHNSLNQNLQKGKIGKLEKIIITSRDPEPPPINYLKTSGGIFKDMMIHDFDLARFYAGNDEFDSIFATISRIALLVDPLWWVTFYSLVAPPPEPHRGKSSLN